MAQNKAKQKKRKEKKTLARETLNWVRPCIQCDSMLLPPLKKKEKGRKRERGREREIKEGGTKQGEKEGERRETWNGRKDKEKEEKR